MPGVPTTVEQKKEPPEPNNIRNKTLQQDSGLAAHMMEHTSDESKYTDDVTKQKDPLELNLHQVESPPSSNVTPYSSPPHRRRYPSPSSIDGRTSRDSSPETIDFPLYADPSPAFVPRLASMECRAITPPPVSAPPPSSPSSFCSFRYTCCPMCPKRFENKQRAAFHMQVHRQKTWKVSKTARNCQERRIEEESEGLSGRRDPRFFYTKSGVVKGRGFPLNFHFMSKRRYHYEKRYIYQKQVLLRRFLWLSSGQSFGRSVARQHSMSSSCQAKGKPSSARRFATPLSPRSFRKNALLSRQRRPANLPKIRSKKLRMTSGIVFCESLKYNGTVLYVCRACPFVTWKLSSIWHHFRHHLMKTAESYNCTNCTYSSTELDRIEQHIKMHMYKHDASYSQYKEWLRYERNKYHRMVSSECNSVQKQTPTVYQTQITCPPASLSPPNPKTEDTVLAFLLNSPTQRKQAASRQIVFIADPIKETAVTPPKQKASSELDTTSLKSSKSKPNTKIDGKDLESSSTAMNDARKALKKPLMTKKQIECTMKTGTNQQQTNAKESTERATSKTTKLDNRRAAAPQTEVSEPAPSTHSNAITTPTHQSTSRKSRGKTTDLSIGSNPKQSVSSSSNRNVESELLEISREPTEKPDSSLQQLQTSAIHKAPSANSETNGSSKPETSSNIDPAFPHKKESKTSCIATPGPEKVVKQLETPTVGAQSTSMPAEAVTKNVPPQKNLLVRLKASNATKSQRATDHTREEGVQKNTNISTSDISIPKPLKRPSQTFKSIAKRSKAEVSEVPAPAKDASHMNSQLTCNSSNISNDSEAVSKEKDNTAKTLSLGGDGSRSSSIYQSTTDEPSVVNKAVSEASSEEQANPNQKTTKPLQITPSPILVTPSNSSQEPDEVSVQSVLKKAETSMELESSSSPIGEVTGNLNAGLKRQMPSQTENEQTSEEREPDTASKPKKRTLISTPPTDYQLKVHGDKKAETPMEKTTSNMKTAVNHPTSENVLSTTQDSAQKIAMSAEAHSSASEAVSTLVTSSSSPVTTSTDTAKPAESSSQPATAESIPCEAGNTQQALSTSSPAISSNNEMSNAESTTDQRSQAEATSADPQQTDPILEPAREKVKNAWSMAERYSILKVPLTATCDAGIFKTHISLQGREKNQASSSAILQLPDRPDAIFDGPTAHPLSARKMERLLQSNERRKAFIREKRKKKMLEQAEKQKASEESSPDSNDAESSQELPVERNVTETTESISNLEEASERRAPLSPFTEAFLAEADMNSRASVSILEGASEQPAPLSPFTEAFLAAADMNSRASVSNLEGAPEQPAPLSPFTEAFLAEADMNSRASVSILEGASEQPAPLSPFTQAFLAEADMNSRASISNPVNPKVRRIKKLKKLKKKKLKKKKKIKSATVSNVEKSPSGADNSNSGIIKSTTSKSAVFGSLSTKPPADFLPNHTISPVEPGDPSGPEFSVNQKAVSPTVASSKQAIVSDTGSKLNSKSELLSEPQRTSETGQKTSSSVTPENSTKVWLVPKEIFKSTVPVRVEDPRGYAVTVPGTYKIRIYPTLSPDLDPTVCMTFEDLDYSSPAAMVAALRRLNIKPLNPFRPRVPRGYPPDYHHGISAIESELFKELVIADPSLPVPAGMLNVLAARPAEASNSKANRRPITKSIVVDAFTIVTKEKAVSPTVESSEPAVAAEAGSKLNSKSDLLSEPQRTSETGQKTSSSVTQARNDVQSSSGETPVKKVSAQVDSVTTSITSAIPKKLEKADSTSTSASANTREPRVTTVKPNRNQAPPNVSQIEKSIDLTSARRNSKPEAVTDQTATRSQSEGNATRKPITVSEGSPIVKRTTRSLSKQKENPAAVPEKIEPVRKEARTRSSSKAALPSRSTSKEATPAPKTTMPPLRRSLRDVPSRRAAQKDSSPTPKKQKLDDDALFKVPELPHWRKPDFMANTPEQGTSTKTDEKKTPSPSSYVPYEYNFDLSKYVWPPFVPPPKKTKKQLEAEREAKRIEEEIRSQPDWQEEPFVEPVFDPKDYVGSTRVNKRDPPYPKFEDFVKLDPVPPHYYTERHPDDAHEMLNEAIKQWHIQLSKRQAAARELFKINCERVKIGLKPRVPSPPRTPTNFELRLRREQRAFRFRQCPDCSYTNRKSIVEFRIHRSHHCGEGAYKCQECNFHSLRSVDIQRHMWFDHYLPDTRSVEGIESSESEEEVEVRPPPPPRRKQTGRRRRRNW